MNLGTPYSGNSMRIGDLLKSNQSITYSENEVPEPVDLPNPYGAQIYLQKEDQAGLLQKYMLLCLEVERITRLSGKHQSMVISLMQEVQRKTTDFESFRHREDILQRELKKLQQQDKQLLSSNHKLEQILLEKTRMMGLLEQEIVMTRGKSSSSHPKDNFDQKIRMREMQMQLVNQKSRFVQLERQLREAGIMVERAEQRMNQKAENDRGLLINSQNRIKDLEEQLRMYVAQKRLLEQNELRFMQQQKNFEQVKTVEFTKHVEQMDELNKDLMGERHRTTGQIAALEKDLAEAVSQLKIKSTEEAHHHKTVSSLQLRLESLTKTLNQKDRVVSQYNSDKSDLEYRLQTTTHQLRRIEGLYGQSQSQACKNCSHLEGQNNSLALQLRRSEQAMLVKDTEYRVVILQSQKDIKNLRELLQAMNNLKGSNERVSRLIQVSTQKLIKTGSTRAVFSSGALS